MAPSVSDAAAKVADVAAGTKSSAKDIKKESTTARMLGAGMCTRTGDWTCIVLCADYEKDVRVSQN